MALLDGSISVGLVPVVPDGIVWAANYRKFPKKVFKPPFPEPDPANSDGVDASLWQLQGNLTIKYDDFRGGKRRTIVDLSSSLVRDPSVKS